MPSFVHTVPLCTAVLLSLSISACKPTSTAVSNSDTESWSCQSQDAPFSYSACRITAEALSDGRYALKLFWQQSESDQTLLTFDKLLSTLPDNQALSFAMNAGMYNKDYAPIGYTIIEGKEIKSLNLKEGGGNFHLLPNGVMWWNKSGNIQISISYCIVRCS